MESRYRTKKVGKATREGWLTVGQQVKVLGVRYCGKNGTITAIDKRFNRPYSVRVILPSGRKVIVHYGVKEVRITRFEA